MIRFSAVVNTLDRLKERGIYQQCLFLFSKFSLRAVLKPCKNVTFLIIVRVCIMHHYLGGSEEKELHPLKAEECLSHDLQWVQVLTLTPPASAPWIDPRPYTEHLSYYFVTYSLHNNTRFSSADILKRIVHIEVMFFLLCSFSDCCKENNSTLRIRVPLSSAWPSVL